jgi:hypothetical protein
VPSTLIVRVGAVLQVVVAVVVDAGTVVMAFVP